MFYKNLKFFIRGSKDLETCFTCPVEYLMWDTDEYFSRKYAVSTINFSSVIAILIIIVVSNETWQKLCNFIIQIGFTERCSPVICKHDPGVTLRFIWFRIWGSFFLTTAKKKGCISTSPILVTTSGPQYY